MNDSMPALFKIFVKQFYRDNAAFFLLIITLTFGFMSGVEHRALAEFFTSSSISMLAPVAIWTFYSFKVYRFNKRILSGIENLFLYNFTLLPAGTRLKLLWVIGVFQQLPVLLYASFLVVIAVLNQTYAPIFICTFIPLTLTFFCAWMLQRELQNLSYEKKINWLTPALTFRSNTLLRIYLGWLLNKEPFLILGTKIFTTLIIYGVGNLYQGELYDHRLMTMGVTVAVAANFPVIQRLLYFEHSEFLFVKNLPISNWGRLLNIIAVLCTLLIIESVTIVKLIPAHLDMNDVLLMILFGVSLLIFLYSVQLLARDVHTQVVFGAIISLFVIILFQTPLWLLVCLLLTSGSLIYVKRYFNFELRL
jgi:hypothetical protein